MIKIIAMDLDGTLFSPDHKTVAEENKKALRAAHKAGIKLAVATGRTYSTIGDICEQVPEIDYIIFSNGAGVYDRKSGRIVYHNVMPFELCDKLLPLAVTKCRLAELYIGGRAYALKKPGGELDKEVLPPVFRPMLGKEIGIVEDYHFDDGVEKAIFFFGDDGECRETADKIKECGEVFVTSSIPCSFEFTKAGVDKGEALLALCKIIGASADEAMAFGDAENDIPMLRAAGCGIAMENADDETKASAKYVTASNAESGVALAINKYAFC